VATHKHWQAKLFFFNFPFQLAYIFSIFHSNFFKFASLKFKKKNRASRDVWLAFKLAREQVSLLLFQNSFALNFYLFQLSILYFFNRIFVNFYLFQLSILYFFNRIFVNFIYSNFHFLFSQKSKQIFFKLLLEFQFSIFVNSLVNLVFAARSHRR
jgi:hypothetical protein